MEINKIPQNLDAVKSYLMKCGWDIYIYISFYPFFIQLPYSILCHIYIVAYDLILSHIWCEKGKIMCMFNVLFMLLN